MHVSLDGLAARIDGRTDWIGTDSEAFFDLYDRVDACVLGRKMYPEYEQYWRAIVADPTGPLAMTGAVPTAEEVRYAEFADSTPHYVLSHRPNDLDWPVASPIADLDAIRTLREQPGRDIYLVGGPATVGAVLDAGLIDELQLTVHPVILGGGTPLFGQAFGEHVFTLTSATPMSGGVIKLVYVRS